MGTVSQHQAVGVSVPRVDAEGKVTGRALFAADMRTSGMLHMKVRRARVASARVTRIEVSECEATPGVVRVLTAEDIPGNPLMGFPVRDHPILVSDRVRFCGDALALVVAETETAAAEGAGKIKVSFSDFPAVLDPEEALGPDAPILHEGGNVAARHKVRKGDVVQGFSQAHTIVEGEYRTGFVEHSYMEPEAVFAVPDEDCRRVSVWGSLQSPFVARRWTAGLLGWSEDRVRIIQAATGGSFGGKDDVVYEMCAQAALAAVTTKRPIRCVNSREESILASYKRHPFIIRHRLGADRDGRLCAAEVSMVANTGAYAAAGPFVMWRACVHACGPYVIPHVKVDGVAVYTNQSYCGAMRGFGNPQVTFAAESQMDELARVMGFDPAELRVLNALNVGSVTATGQKLEHSVGLAQTIERARPEGQRAAQAVRESTANDELVGLGLACGYHGVSLGAEGEDVVEAWARLESDGGITIATGLTDYGAGGKTVLCQIAAQTLDLPVDRVRIEEVDTSLVGNGGPTVASRLTYMSGKAVEKACQDLARLVLTEVGGKAGVGNHHGWKLACGSVLDSEGSVIADLAQVAAGVGGASPLVGQARHFCPPTTWDEEKGSGHAYSCYGFATQVAVVTISKETGEVRVRHVVAAHDVGRAINPQCVRGQINGGIAMGVGFALHEKVRFQNGVPVTSNFDTYHLLGALQMPEVTSIVVEAPEPSGPFGAKGSGELPTVPTAPAIANAVRDAAGVRFYQLPIEPSQVKEALISR